MRRGFVAFNYLVKTNRGIFESERNGVTKDRHRHCGRCTVGHTFLLLLRNEAGSARHSSSLFQGWPGEPGVLPLDNFELRANHNGRGESSVGTSGVRP